MNVSVRLDDGLAERLRLRARAAGETLSDVWEVALWMEDLDDERDSSTALAAEGIVTLAQIDAAAAYRADYPEEIDARVERHRRATAAAARR